MQLHLYLAHTPMPHVDPTPTTQQIRDAVATIHNGVHDPDACPNTIAAAHATLTQAQHTSRPPVQTWLTDYLAPHTTAHGPEAFRSSVHTLAQHFKLPPIKPIPPPGTQGTLFD